MYCAVSNNISRVYISWVGGSVELQFIKYKSERVSPAHTLLRDILLWL